MRASRSIGTSRSSVASMARPSCRKKNSMNSIMKKPTSVPNTPSARSPPMVAADLSSPWMLSLNQPWI